MWKDEVKRRENLKPLQVDYDQDTKQARKSFKCILRQSNKSQEFINQLEEEIFKENNKLINKRYRIMVNNCICELRREENQRICDPKELINKVIEKYH